RCTGKRCITPLGEPMRSRLRTAPKPAASSQTFASDDPSRRRRADVRVEDWSQATADEMAPFIAAEIHAWRADLEWDVEREWRQVEIARAAGRLPGLVARDENGTITGWTFFLLHHDALQIATLS